MQFEPDLFRHDCVPMVLQLRGASSRSEHLVIIAFPPLHSLRAQMGASEMDCSGGLKDTTNSGTLQKLMVQFEPKMGHTDEMVLARLE